MSARHGCAIQISGQLKAGRHETESCCYLVLIKKGQKKRPAHHRLQKRGLRLERPCPKRRTAQRLAPRHSQWQPLRTNFKPCHAGLGATARGFDPSHKTMQVINYRVGKRTRPLANELIARPGTLELQPWRYSWTFGSLVWNLWCTCPETLSSMKTVSRNSMKPHWHVSLTVLCLPR